MEELNDRKMSDEKHRSLIEAIIKNKTELLKLPFEEKRKLLAIVKEESEWCSRRLESARKELKLYSDFYDIMKSLKEKQ